MLNSKKVASAALEIAMTETREEEKQCQEHFSAHGIKAVAVDYGGEGIHSVSKIIERAVVAAKREGVIADTHAEQGAVAGATHEAVSQIMLKIIGLNIGGKIGIARSDDHISVAIFFGVGMLHLDEIAVAVAHRAVHN
ncbi:MAG: hut operon positive regulator HutP [Peptococcaceae bacterium]|jgi:hypothetical protein|nr:hut operon positive regulator HutP [Peptococcaceae bacterium]